MDWWSSIYQMCLQSIVFGHQDLGILTGQCQKKLLQWLQMLQSQNLYGGLSSELVYTFLNKEGTRSYG